MNVLLKPTLAELPETNRQGLKLQLEKIQLRQIEMPLKAPFETSFGVTTKRRILIVQVFDKSGASGYGECTAMEEPFFNHETIDTAWSIISKFAAPMLAFAPVSGASDVAGAPPLSRATVWRSARWKPLFGIWRQRF